MPRHRLLQPLLDPLTQSLAVSCGRLAGVAWRHSSTAKLVGHLPPRPKIAGEGPLGDERLEIDPALGRNTAVAIKTESLQQRANGFR